jgi:hypothetical protein
MNIVLRISSSLLLSSMCMSCDSTPHASSDAQDAVVGATGPITADQLCRRLTSDEVGRAIGRTIVRRTVATTNNGVALHMCNYYFGASDQDRIEISIAVDSAARPAVGDAPWPPALNVRCESVGVGENEAGGCDAVLALGIRATVLGRGGVMSPSAGGSIIAALRNQP